MVFKSAEMNKNERLEKLKFSKNAINLILSFQKSHFQFPKISFSISGYNWNLSNTLVYNLLYNFNSNNSFIA